MTFENKKKVCIVGGGPAGLVSLRRVLESPVLTGKLFEQKDDIGGLWNYDGTKQFVTSPKNLSGSFDGHPDPEAVTTMYDGLRCNLPYPLMQFRDFPHREGQSSFPTQREMHQYMRNYATNFDLWPSIKVNTSIVNIRPETPIESSLGDTGRWIVESHNHKEDKYSTEVFDSVIICVGKNSYPYKPDIPGLETFKGKVLHSKYFKNPLEEKFKDKNIVCIGLGPTSADMVLSLSKTAKNVTLCHKFFAGLKLGLLPRNAREVANVKLITENEVVTEDDQVIPCDIIILCTGYALKLPFLDHSCGITVVDEKYIPHLYNMTIFTKRPTLAILNLCYRSPEYFIIEVQARYFVKCLEGNMILPSYQEMEATLTAHEEELRKLNRPYSTWFQIGEFGEKSWQFFAQIADDCGISEEYKHIGLLEQLYLAVVFRIFGKAALYKKDVFKEVDENTWELILHYDTEEFPETKPEKVKMTLSPDSTVKVETLEYTE